MESVASWRVVSGSIPESVCGASGALFCLSFPPHTLKENQ